MKSASLQEILNNKIESLGYISTDDLESLVRTIINPKTGEHYKLSNAERRLRPSDSPNVKAERNSKGFITGYRYIGKKITDVWSKKHFINLEKAKQASLI